MLFDCGIHPGLGGLNSLPFFDSIDMESVDALLITHFHLDHCAALPYVLAHTKLKASNISMPECLTLLTDTFFS